tara:strand:- start:4496 stop:5320 length:825 start_codon:yes stop_codon:yes gene_type:complete
MSFPLRYLPKRLTKRDKDKQKKMLNKSRKLYKQRKYYTRKKVASFKSKVSPHVTKARKIYKIEKISASPKLAKATGCSIGTLRKIVKKGQGAYFSSGSRPNQTGHSWGRARLASAITGGKAAAVDMKLLMKGCKSGSKAISYAKQARKKYGYGTRRVPKHKGGGRKTHKKKSKMKETIVKFQKGPGDKKYTAIVKDKQTKKTRILHFGDKNYEQFKDRTNLGIYSHKNHSNKRRQENYYNRHSGEKKRKKAIEKEIRISGGYYTPRLLSHKYLW